MALASGDRSNLWQEITLSGTPLPQGLLRFGLSHECAPTILTGAGERANQTHLLRLLWALGAAQPKRKWLSPLIAHVTLSLKLANRLPSAFETDQLRDASGSNVIQK